MSTLELPNEATVVNSPHATPPVQTAGNTSPVVSLSSADDPKKVTFSLSHEKDDKSDSVVDAREARSKRRLATAEKQQRKSAVTKKPKTPERDVVRVPMRTGVLILHRGLHRRVEFQHKV